jgi:hypothetical protein
MPVQGEVLGTVELVKKREASKGKVGDGPYGLVILPWVGHSWRKAVTRSLTPAGLTVGQNCFPPSGKAVGCNGPRSARWNCHSSIQVNPCRASTAIPSELKSAWSQGGSVSALESTHSNPLRIPFIVI